MKQLRRLAPTCILIASLSVAALADGGIMQGPGYTDPPPPAASAAGQTDGQPQLAPSTLAGEPINNGTDVAALIAWLVASIL